jgi:peptide/nickel transport system substrate-binding protein
MRKSLSVATFAMGMALGAAAYAEDITIAVASEVTAMDPHYHNTGNNNQIVGLVYDRMLHQDSNQQVGPGLAVEWGPIADDVWEFKLREGVTFHDGSAFTAEDVVFSYERVPNVPNSPSSFATYTSGIAEIIVVDDYTIQFRTNGPYPLLPIDLSTVQIVSADNPDATTEDFNSGAASIGTGPYTFVSYTPGESIVLKSNPNYWGGAPDFDTVTYRPISSDAARVAALLAGDVDVISGVPTTDIATLEGNPDIVLSQGVSNRVIYLHIDSRRVFSPFVTDNDGNPMFNPLQDVNVRKALSMAIDRDTIVDEVMEGIAIPAGQVLPDGFFGVSENIEIPEYDPEGAKALLAEAGYPDGFRLTIHGPNDRYINDEQIAQAIAQMLARVGIQTEVETMPRSVYFGRATGDADGSEFSLMLVGWGSGTGEASSPLRALLHTRDDDAGLGRTNRGRFSSAPFDATVQLALNTVDDELRQALLARATEIAMREVGLIPTHFQVNTWGTRTGLRYVPRTDEYTRPTNVVIE